MTLYIDCDVLQADGGTRTAAISGASLALRLAVDKLLNNGFLVDDPYTGLVGAVSVGRVDGRMVCDLSYEQDVRAEIDFNVIMNQQGEFIEIQGTGEKGTFSEDELTRMIDAARKGIEQIFQKQEDSLEAYRRSYTQSW
jgi:ribonuclease PH